MKIDLIIVNAMIVSPSGIEHGCIAVDKGQIQLIGPRFLMPEAQTVIDAGDRYVIPGLVDPHLHYGLVGKGDHIDRVKFDWSADGVGALFGGITTALPMLMCHEGYPEMVRTLIGWGEENSPLDFGFTAIVHRKEHIDELEGLFSQGVTAYKHFLTAFKGKEGEQISLSAVDEGTFFRSLEVIRDLGPPAIAMLHAEDSDLYNVFIPRMRQAGRDGLAAWAEARPQFTEYSRVEFAATLAAEADAPLYFVHLSIKESIDIIRRYKARGARIYAEAVVHTLTVSCHEKETGVWAKFVPPLRDDRTIKALWEGLRSGAIDTVATDHCTYLLEEKEAGQGKFGSIWDPPPGISNVQEHMLPVLWTYGVQSGRITVEDLVSLCSENPARIFGLYPQKGAISMGADADLVIIDDRTIVEVTPKFYHGKDGRLSIYMGKKLTGRPQTTILGGKVVVDHGRYLGQPGDGSYVKIRK